MACIAKAEAWAAWGRLQGKPTPGVSTYPRNTYLFWVISHFVGYLKLGPGAVVATVDLSCDKQGQTWSLLVVYARNIMVQQFLNPKTFSCCLVIVVVFSCFSFTRLLERFGGGVLGTRHTKRNFHLPHLPAMVKGFLDA